MKTNIDRKVLNALKLMVNAYLPIGKGKKIRKLIAEAEEAYKPYVYTGPKTIAYCQRCQNSIFDTDKKAAEFWKEHKVRQCGYCLEMSDKAKKIRKVLDY